AGARERVFYSPSGRCIAAPSGQYIAAPSGYVLLSHWEARLMAQAWRCESKLMERNECSFCTNVAEVGCGNLCKSLMCID
ncbi:MAG: hypothetical protein ACPGII_10380, partial [Opitutales bacterium]